MIIETVRAVLEELEKYRLLVLPGNPSGTVYYIDKKQTAPVETPKKKK